MRMSLIKPPTGKGGKEGQEECAAWPLPLSPPSRDLVVLPACGHANVYTCSLVHACASTTAWLGVNKGSGWFNKSQRDVTGKREGNSLFGWLWLFVSNEASLSPGSVQMK